MLKRTDDIVQSHFRAFFAVYLVSPFVMLLTTHKRKHPCLGHQACPDTAINTTSHPAS